MARLRPRLRQLQLVLWVAMLFCALLPARAQVERVLPRRTSSSLEGTSFIVGFMQNEIRNAGQDPRLQIFISSQYDALVTLHYPSAPYTQVRYVPANTVHVETVLSSYMCSTSEEVERKAIAITSTVPVVVYTLNTLATSTDSYCAIPIKHLGTQYVTVNMPTDHYEPRWPNVELDTARRVGEFMIIAVKNFTDVTITPAVTTKGGNLPWRPFTVRLDSGEVYQVQAQDSPHGVGDLTGSRIEADRPVAVLSGHMRSSMPGQMRSSKDHLVEMLPPLQTWGTEYVTTPFAQVDGGDIVRLMAADADTYVEIVTSDGVVDQYFARAGEWRDVSVEKAVSYRSSKPFFVVQFMPSSRPAAGTSPFYDPAMVVVPAVDQFVESALFQFPVLDTVAQIGAASEFYYYINLVTEAAALPSLRVNRTLVTSLAPEIETQVVPGTTLHWAQIRFTPGSYTLTADSGRFSGVMYGTGYADSYANLFGVSYERQTASERTPPEFALTLACGNITGTVGDVGIDSVGLASVEVQTDQTFNYTWTISNPIDDRGGIEFFARVRDPQRPARMVLHAYDVVGNGREWLYDYRPAVIEVSEDVEVPLRTDQTSCVDVPVVNSTEYDVTIASLVLRGDPQFSMGQTIPPNTVIAAGDTLVVRICYVPDGSSSSGTTTIDLDLGCGIRVVVVVRLQQTASLRFADLDLGDVLVGDTVCGEVPLVNDGTAPVMVDSLLAGVNLGAGKVWYRTSRPALPLRLEPGDTIWFDICATADQEGPGQRTDTIASADAQGVSSTIRLRGVRPRLASIIIDWGNRRVGSRHDTTIVLSNTGTAAAQVSLASPFPTLTDFQDIGRAFPLGLDAGASITLAYAFQPSQTGPVVDSVDLAIDWRGHEDVTLILKGNGQAPELRGTVIDMGNVELGSAKDSIVPYLVGGGTMPATVLQVLRSGADMSAFNLDQQFLDVQTVLPQQSVQGVLRFTPQRPGLHTMKALVVYDGGWNGLADTVEVVIRGTGVERLQADAHLVLNGLPDVRPCTDITVDLVLRNTGETPLMLDSITIDGVPTLTGPFSLLYPNETYDTTIQLPPLPLTSVVDVQAQAWCRDPDDSSVVRLSRYLATLTPLSPAVRLESVSPVAYGQTVVVSLVLEQTLPQSLGEHYRVSISAPSDRWQFVDDPPARVILQGSPDVDVPSTTSIVADQFIMQLLEDVPGQHAVLVRIAGMPIWKDDREIPLTISVDPAVCGLPSDTTLYLSAEVCGGNLRTVRLDVLPVVDVRLASHPVAEELSLMLTSSQQTEIGVHLWSVTGDRYVLCDKLSLQKGTTQCNFSTCEVGSGFYQLCIGYVGGETMIPIVLVK